MFHCFGNKILKRHWEYLFSLFLSKPNSNAQIYNLWCYNILK
jgi:hypothetical protein